MPKLISRLTNSRFVRQLFLLTGSSAAARSLAVAVSPLLTRLYDPEALGFLAVFSGVLVPLIGISSLRYEFALLTIDDHAETRSIYRLCLWLLCFLSLAVTTIGVVLMPLAGRVSSNEYAPWLLPLVGVGLLGGGYYNILTHRALRQQAFGALGVSRLAQGLSSASTQVIGGALLAGPWGLLIGAILGHAGGSVGLRRRLGGRKDWSTTGRRPPTFEIAKAHWRYPAFGAPAVLLYKASQQGPGLLLAFLFGPAAAGSYLLADRVVGAPVKMASAAVAQTFASDAGRSVRLTGSVGRRKVLRTSGLMGALVGPPIIAGGLLAEWGFPIIFGGGWELAGAITQVIVVELLFRVMVVPVTQTYLLSGRHKAQLLFEVGRSAAGVAGLGVPWFLGAPLLTALKYYVGAMVCAYVVAMVFVVRGAGRFESDQTTAPTSVDY